MLDGLEEPPTMDPFQECQEQMRNFEINDRPPSFRHSRAFRNFKNPPQPHLCIRDMTSDGDQEVLINVMSWTRIVKPQTPNDPIPLYGGMRVLGSSTSRLQGSPPQQQQQPAEPQPQAMLFAVMANPEVLKKASRNSVDDQDLNALVELMCEFVEAMNPGLKLLRQPVVLKDRDLSGELKNIWGAVQAKRETEREQFMGSTGKHNPNLVVYTELGPDSAAPLGSQNGNESGDHFAMSMVNGNGGGGGVGATEEVAEKSENNKLTDGEQKMLSEEQSSIENNCKTNNNVVDCSNSKDSNNAHDIDRLTVDDADATRNGLNGGDQQPNVNVPQESKLAQDSNSNNKRTVEAVTKLEATLTLTSTQEHPVPASNVVAPVTTTATSPVKGGGKAEKEVANVKEKKEKSISGFLHNGLFGRRNKDKEKDSGGGGTKKEGKPKLSASFKSRLLLSGSRAEKEDKGTDAVAAAKKEAADKKNSQFSEIGQSMTAAK